MGYVRRTYEWFEAWKGYIGQTGAKRVFRETDESQAKQQFNSLPNKLDTDEYALGPQDLYLYRITTIDTHKVNRWDNDAN